MYRFGVLLLISAALFTNSSGTLLKPPPPPLHEPSPPDWWKSPSADIVDNYTASSANLVCLAEDCFNDKFLRRINKSVIVWQYDERNVTVPRGNEWDTFVVFLSYENAILDFFARHETSAKPLYLFILPVDATYDDVRAVFESCFAKYILRTVAIVPKVTEVFGNEVVRSMSTYTYNPYNDDSHCLDTTPSLIFTWDVTDDLRKKIRPIPDRIIRSVHGCTVRVAARTIETNLIISSSNLTGNWSFEGPWARIFLAIIEGMDANLDLRKSDDEGFPDEHEEGDEMFFGRFSTNEERYKSFDFPSASRVQCYTFCVPRPPRQEPVWFLLVGEYAWEVWLLLLITLFAVAAVYIPMQRWKKKSFGCSLFYFFAAVNSSMQPNPKWDSARIVFALWSMFLLVMTTAYIAVLQGFRTAPPQLDSVDDYPSLLDSTFIIRGPSVLITVVLNIQDKSQHGHKLISRLIPYADGSDIDEESLREQYVHICSSIEFISLSNRKPRRTDGRLRYYKLLNNCILTQTERLVLLTRHSPFLGMVSDITLRLTEGGLIAHVMDIPEPFDIVIVGVQPINLSRVQSPLALLAVGHTAALLVFVAEIRGSMDWT